MGVYIGFGETPELAFADAEKRAKEDPSRPKGAPFDINVKKYSEMSFSVKLYH